MDIPGLSLFQGAESLQLNSSTQQRIEEQDALEDQKRRNEELKNELQNAFDDLDDEFDDDEDASECYNTVDNTSICNRKSQLQNGYGNGKRSPTSLFNGQNNNNDFENELRRMKIVIDSKNEELKNISAMNADQRARYESQVDELKKRLAITEAEKERAHMSRKQTHELVVEAKQKLAEREEHILELNAKIKVLDSRNLALVTELEHTKALLSDTQHKYHMVERNANLSSDKHTDAIVKQLNERFAAQTDMMQQQINTMRIKLEEKDSEVKRLQIQNMELHKSRESMLIDKSDTINQLTQKLEVSQRQCQNLILKNGSDSELVHENIKLMRTVSALEQHTEDMQKTIDGLAARLDSTTAELEQMTDGPIHDEMTSNGLAETPLSRNFNTKTVRKRDEMVAASTSTPLVVIEDRLIRFKQEYNRCMTDQRTKHQEIAMLKEQLDKQMTEIDRMRVDENRALIEVNTSREKIERLENKLKIAETELDKLRAASTTDGVDPHNAPQYQSSMARLAELERQLHLQQKENEDFRQNCDHLRATIKELEDERDRISEKCRIATAAQDALQSKCGEMEKERLGQQAIANHLELTLQSCEKKCDHLMRILDREQIDYETSFKHLNAEPDQDGIANDLRSQKKQSNACTNCINLTTKISQLEIEALQAQTSCSNHLQEIHELKRSLKEANNSIAELQAQMKMKREHDQMIVDLRKKAEQFEEFMRNQSPTRHEMLNIVSDRNARDQCVSTDDDMLTYELPRTGSVASVNSTDRSVERRMREEMARAMAVQIKTLENQHKEEKRKYEEHIQRLSQELSEMSNALGAREQDISALKQCILSERAAIKEILAEKDANTESKLKRQHNVIVAMHADLDTAHKRIGYLTKELDETSQQYQAERQSANKLMEEWKSELEALIERETILTQQIQQMENEHKSAIQTLNEKYVAAKKTAANYKKYSDDKEEHIKRESARIKSAYEKAVKQVKENMEKAIKENERKTNKRIAELQAKYENSNGKV